MRSLARIFSRCDPPVPAAVAAAVHPVGCPGRAGHAHRDPGRLVVHLPPAEPRGRDGGVGAAGNRLSRLAASRWWCAGLGDARSCRSGDRVRRLALAAVGERHHHRLVLAFGMTVGHRRHRAGHRAGAPAGVQSGGRGGPARRPCPGGGPHRAHRSGWGEAGDRRRVLSRTLPAACSGVRTRTRCPSPTYRPARRPPVSPISLVRFCWSLPGRVLGDVRVALAAAFVVPWLVLAVRSLRQLWRRPVAESVVAVAPVVLALTLPATLRVMQQSWTDSLLVGLLMVAVLCWRSTWVVLPLGLALATKQHALSCCPCCRSGWAGGGRSARSGSQPRSACPTCSPTRTDSSAARSASSSTADDRDLDLAVDGAAGGPAQPAAHRHIPASGLRHRVAGTPAWTARRSRSRPRSCCARSTSPTSRAM